MASPGSCQPLEECENKSARSTVTSLGTGSDLIPPLAEVGICNRAFGVVRFVRPGHDRKSNFVYPYLCAHFLSPSFRLPVVNVCKTSPCAAAASARLACVDCVQTHPWWVRFIGSSSSCERCGAVPQGTGHARSVCFAVLMVSHFAALKVSAFFLFASVGRPEISYCWLDVGNTTLPLLSLRGKSSGARVLPMTSRFDWQSRKVHHAKGSATVLPVGIGRQFQKSGPQSTLTSSCRRKAAAWAGKMGPTESAVVSTLRALSPAGKAGDTCTFWRCCNDVKIFQNMSCCIAHHRLERFRGIAV